MGYELAVFILFGFFVLLQYVGGLSKVFHNKTKPITEKMETGIGLVNLFLGTIGIFLLLRMAGVIQ